MLLGGSPWHWHYTPPAQASRMHFHQMQLYVALLYQHTLIWMRAVRMTCLQCQLMQWMDADEKWERRNVFIAHWSLGKKKKEKKRRSWVQYISKICHWWRRSSLLRISMHAELIMQCVLQIASVSFRMVAADVAVTFILFTLEWVCDAWPFTCLLHSSPLFSPGKEGSLSCTRRCEGPEGVHRYRAAPCWVIMPRCCGSSFQMHSQWVVRRVGSLLPPLAGISREMANPCSSPKPFPALLRASGFMCVCVFVSKPCISIPYLSLLMSRELWQRPSVAFCL